jgi:hypothetical protein
VRTIVGKINETDQTTKKHRARVGIDPRRVAAWKRRRRTGNALPKQASARGDGRP